MKHLLLLVALLACPSVAHSQGIALWVTNYTHTVSHQNNLGKFFKTWVTESTDVESLDGFLLTVSHTVHYGSVQKFWVQPKRIETRNTYRRTGWSSYRMVEAIEIVWFAERALEPGWIASTNIFEPIADSYPWAPEMTGDDTRGDAFWRTVDIGSALTLDCRNLASQAWLFRIPCWTPAGQSFWYYHRMESEQRKSVSFGPSAIDDVFRSFHFALDQYQTEPAL